VNSFSVKRNDPLRNHTPKPQKLQEGLDTRPNRHRRFEAPALLSAVFRLANPSLVV